jgi:hypothetical protein
MLMSNVLGSAGPPVWVNQATLSAIDPQISQDPENSGFGPIQVVVWEEWIPAPALSWDIYMSFSLLDGVLGSWSLPIAVTTTPLLDEIHSAVAVTNVNPITGFTEIHVVYQILRGVQWDVEHTWANLVLPWVWSVPVILDAAHALSAENPAIVFTEDLSVPGPSNGMLVQFVWSEATAGPPPSVDIQYTAYYQDPTLIPVRGYMPITLISMGGTFCDFPEIASVDERLNPISYDYYFSVVWQESIVFGGQTNILYNDGTTTTSGGGFITLLTPGSLGQLNLPNVIGNCYRPDISASQDYAIVETYYFHVNWLFQITGPPITYQIDTCYYVGPLTTPGSAAFILTAPASGPILAVLDDPTIATKMVMLPGLIPAFETWMCWEDSSTPGTIPDIWYIVGQCPIPGLFGYTVVAAVVPYLQVLTSEFNPELWNRNDSTRMFPPMTHLVFDMTSILVVQEVEYIDP